MILGPVLMEWTDIDRNREKGFPENQATDSALSTRGEYLVFTVSTCDHICLLPVRFESKNYLRSAAGSEYHANRPQHL